MSGKTDTRISAVHSTKTSQILN